MGYRPQTPNWSNAPQFFPQVPLQQNQYSQMAVRNETAIAQIKLITLSQKDRAEAIQSLSHQREQIPNIGVLLWESPASVAALLEEIISVVPHIAAISNSPVTTQTTISSNHAARVCYALTLFQSIAVASDEVRTQFLKADIPSYLTPFLHTLNQSRECEHFKLASLGIIGTIAMSNSQEAFDYLISKDFVPLCLRILKFSSEIHKIFASYIIQRILSTQRGIDEICKDAEKIKSVLDVLYNEVKILVVNYNPRIVRNIIFAYQYLFQSKVAVSILSQYQFDELDTLAKSQKCEESFLKLIYQLVNHQFA
ncbi:Cell differentiation family, Rcd1-like containing protein [Trichomonas vaginalis G3]|uniref:Cell differentiation family, Rcd1-like containing protein n=1 Tax=Trichomonas vaginalis (strain ATCC PRA-98 / G3) TaxID=412133 RepID=A2FPD4_TRIV3|nr:positive regulation of nuclear receptor transcription coactivator protein [Trichomonas vaginalis G3]EAX93247.1 Cell differentiation family, Rcd1-like containing protein [Trichomonas vaginalis G3]KAI5516863.1 positive regulation of nuclear receptor transcription coactivator protein [Trichomonas vaginalis G3]|eukprot:XP_001306177.1 Cell differentiation family, Rcd1-like containing protein [Trichomonas vaginalis G3]